MGSGTTNQINAAENKKNKIEATNINLTTDNKKMVVDVEENKAVQNFCIDGNVLYTSQRISKTKDAGPFYVKITKYNIVDGKNIFESTMVIEDAGHGQTLEIYRASGKTYILFALKDYFIEDSSNKSHWSTQIGRIEYKGYKNDNDAENNAKKYTAFKRFTNLNYANKDHKNFGTVKRADAAVSTNGKYILIWIRNKNNDNQFSAYKMTSFNDTLDKSKENGVSFKEKKLNPIFSFTKEKGNTDIPESVQSIEISNAADESVKDSEKSFSIYIASGDDGVNDKPVMIYRLNSKGQLKAKANIEYSEVFGVKMEIEGIHIVGSELYFWFVESGYLNGKDRNNENKYRQYIMSINKDLLKGGK